MCDCGGCCQDKNIKGRLELNIWLKLLSSVGFFLITFEEWLHISTQMSIWKTRAFGLSKEVCLEFPRGKKKNLVDSLSSEKTIRNKPLRSFRRGAVVNESD